MKLNLFGPEQHFSFQGAYNHWIELTMYPLTPSRAGHVVILALYKGQLLFTKHKERGYEWPGGKVEENEEELVAALRELKEETGGFVSSIVLVGQYKVIDGESSFIKNVYIADVYQLDQRLISGIDTERAVLFPLDIVPSSEEGFSPLVTDPVFQLVREKVLAGDN